MFGQTCQDSNENTDACVMRLKKIAANWDFHNIEDGIIDQIIVKCFSSCLRRKLLQEFVLTYSLLMISKAMKVTEQQATSLEGKISNVVSTLDGKTGKLNQNSFKNYY